MKFEGNISDRDLYTLIHGPAFPASPQLEALRTDKKMITEPFSVWPGKKRRDDVKVKVTVKVIGTPTPEQQAILGVCDV